MTTLRGIRREEVAAYNKLASICFTYTLQPEHMDGKDMPEERLKEMMGVFDEQNQLLGGMIQLDFDCRFEGQSTKMLGIGGVVTDPAQRRHGAIRQLFEEGLPRLRDKGFVFSSLYPFSHVFYRKFGYELCILRRNAELHPSALRKNLYQASSIRRVLPDEDDSGMQKVYEGYIADKNLAVIRREDHWKAQRAGTPWENLKHSYVLMDENGGPFAYWIGEMRKENGEGVLTIKDMAYTSRKGCEAIFAMFATMNEIGKVQLTVPQDLELRFLVSDPYDVKEYTECGGMVRVMDVERALAMLPAPMLPGSFTVEVQDGQIPQNNGCFTVTSDGYKIAVERSQGHACDLRCSINGLTALVTGVMGFEDVVAAGLAEVWNDKNRRLMAATFCQKKIHLHNYF